MSFNVIALSIDVDLLPLIVNDVSRWHNSAVSDIEMEQSQEVVHILGGQEIRDLQWKVEPSWDCYLRVSAWSAPILRDVLLNLHVNLIRVGVEVEHDRLLCESVLIMNFGRNIVEILVNRLFDVENTGVNPVDVMLHVLESLHSFLDLPI